MIAMQGNIMRLRPYQPGEEQQLWELYQGLAPQHTEQVTEPSHWLAQLRTQLPFVVEYDHQVIGYVSLERAGEIGHFYVHQDWQGRGVGTLLMHQVHQQAREQGVSQLRAYVSDTAIAFFSRWGFAPQPQSAHAASSCSILMAKNLA
jgi:putative acetyltransferase